MYMDQRCDVCGKLLIPSNKFDERGNEFLCCPQGCDPNQNTWDYDQLCQEIETFDEEITEAYQPSENIYLAAKAIEIQDGEIGNTYQSLFGDYQSWCHCSDRMAAGLRWKAFKVMPPV